MRVPIQEEKSERLPILRVPSTSSKRCRSLNLQEVSVGNGATFSRTRALSISTRAYCNVALMKAAVSHLNRVLLPRLTKPFKSKCSSLLCLTAGLLYLITWHQRNQGRRSCRGRTSIPTSDLICSCKLERFISKRCVNNFSTKDKVILHHCMAKISKSSTAKRLKHRYPTKT